MNVTDQGHACMGLRMFIKSGFEILFTFLTEARMILYENSDL